MLSNQQLPYYLIPGTFSIELAECAHLHTKGGVFLSQEAGDVLSGYQYSSPAARARFASLRNSGHSEASALQICVQVPSHQASAEPLSANENRWLHHMVRWGSDGYPIRQVKGGWIWDVFCGIKGSPIVYKTRTECLQAIAAYETSLSERASECALTNATAVA